VEIGSESGQAKSTEDFARIVSPGATPSRIAGDKPGDDRHLSPRRSDASWFEELPGHGVIANHRTHLLVPLIGFVVLAAAVQGITSFVLTQPLSKAAQRLIARRGRANVSSSQPRQLMADGRQAGECQPACRLNRRDLVIVDEESDECRAVTIKSRPRPVGQEAGRKAGLPDAITPCFGYSERLERVHSAQWSLSRVRWYPTTLRQGR
jgi:hypothetical protein